MRHSILVLALIAVSEAFVPLKRQCRKPLFNSKSGTAEGTKQKSNKAMKFLKKIGRVGGAANKDFRYAIGIDEGPSSKFQGGHKVRC